MEHKGIKFAFRSDPVEHHTPHFSKNHFKFGKKIETKKKPILFRRPRSSVEIANLLRETKRQEFTARCLQLMYEGTWCIKYNRSCLMSRRFVSMDKEGTEIRWETPFERSARSAVSLLARKQRARLLADVTGVIYSSLVEFTYRRSRFEVYNKQGLPPWLCMTVLFDRESLDLVFQNEEQVDTWFFGLQNTSPMSKFFLSRGAQLAFRAQLKVERLATDLKKSRIAVIVDLLKEAKEAVSAEIAQDAATTASIVHEGVLKKKSRTSVLFKHPWQSRHFEIRYFKGSHKGRSRITYSKKKGQPNLGTIDLVDIKLCEQPDGKGSTRLDLKLIGGRVFSLNASTTAEAIRWQHAIEDSLKYVSDVKRIPDLSPGQEKGKFWKSDFPSLLDSVQTAEANGAVPEDDDDMPANVLKKVVRSNSSAYSLADQVKSDYSAEEASVVPPLPP